VKLTGWEGRKDRLAPLSVFFARWFGSLALALVFLTASLAVGMVGYAGLEHLSWVDAFENAAMILSGMGPVEGMKTDAGKIFAGSYAIFSGIVVIAATGVMLAPVIHRVVHGFHVEDDDG
jgi:hypothetical protein